MQETQLQERPASAKNAEPSQKRQKPGLSGFALPAGRPKGVPNKLTQSLKEAVERAARDCHPQGLAGWLVERAQGGVQDRQIFAGLVGKVIPIQVNQAVSGGVSISLNWLGSRNIGTIAAQPKVIDAQTIDLIEESQPRHWIADATGAEPAAQGLQATQHGSGHQGSQGPANAAPEPVKTLSRASGGQADPPPPVDPDMGGVSRSRGPLPPSSTPKKPFCAALTTNQPAEP